MEKSLRICVFFILDFILNLVLFLGQGAVYVASNLRVSNHLFHAKNAEDGAKHAELLRIMCLYLCLYFG